MEKEKRMLGIDIGSTTVKVVLLRNGEILYSKYERHLSQVRQKTLEIISEIKDKLDTAPFTVAVSGSAGLGLAQAANLPFIRRYTPPARW